MKKFVLALFVVGIALPSFAGGLKAKDVAGTWSYEVVTDMETLTGTMEFERSGKELTGKVFNNGQTIPITKVEIRDNNVLYCEMEIDYAPYEMSITIEGKKFKGTIGTDEGEVPISGAKIE